jgi:lipoate-protein ligase A
MSIPIKKYDLPDIDILTRQTSSSNFCVWIPDKTCLILGKSNNIEKSLNTGSIKKDGIQVYKRPSGGESVILTPRTIVISALVKSDALRYTRKYFRIFNQKIIKVLENLEIKTLCHKGISDIALRDKKILGSAIYRSKNRLFYHSVLNVSEPVSTIEKYIKHPSREPEYRNGRSHSEFITSLHAEEYKINIVELKNSLRRLKL